MSDQPNRLKRVKIKPCGRPGCPQYISQPGYRYCTVCGNRLRARMVREGYLTPNISREELFRRKSYLPKATLADDATASGEDAIRALEDC